MKNETEYYKNGAVSYEQIGDIQYYYYNSGEIRTAIRITDIIFTQEYYIFDITHHIHQKSFLKYVSNCIILTEFYISNLIRFEIK